MFAVNNKCICRGSHGAKKSQMVNIDTHDIKMGFGVTANVANIGTSTLTNVGWSIAFEAIVPIGGYSEVTISSLDPDETVTIRSGFLFGIGPGWFLVSAGDESDSVNCFIIELFVLPRLGNITG